MLASSKARLKRAGRPCKAAPTLTGQLLRRLRIGRKMSQVELASRAGLSKRTIKRWELGESRLLFKYIQSLRFAMNLTEDETALLVGSLEYRKWTSAGIAIRVGKPSL